MWTSTFSRQYLRLRCTTDVRAEMSFRSCIEILCMRFSIYICLDFRTVQLCKMSDHDVGSTGFDSPKYAGVVFLLHWLVVLAFEVGISAL